MANPIIEQFRQYKIYTDLNERADKVFPTTQIAQNFKELVDKAYTGEESLDQFVFAIETFETLQASAYTPLFTGELERLAVDPKFADFAKISSDIQMPYSTEAAFAAPTAMAKALTEELVSTGDTTTLVEADTTPASEAFDAVTQLKETDKIVLNLNPTTKVAENPEVLFTSEGIADSSNVTTNQAEAERLAVAETAIAAAQGDVAAPDLTAVENIVDSFNAESAPAPADTVFDAVNPLAVNDEAQQAVNAAMETIEDAKKIAIAAAEQTAVQ